MKFNLFKKPKQKEIKFLRSSENIFSNGYEDIFDSYNLKHFKESLYLFIGVSMIRETISSIELDLYDIKNLDGDNEEVYDDPLLDLMHRPNSLQTTKEFLKLAVSYFLLGGETFWYLQRNSETEIPTAMVNIRPDNVTILFNQANTDIIGYEIYQPNGQILKLPLFNILHIKNIDPTDVTRGVGVIRSASTRIITEKEASQYQANTFHNQGRPDIAVMTDVEDLGDEEAEEARLKWAKVYGGANGSKTGFFGSNVKDVKMLNVSPKEMDFIQSMNFLRDDILAALRIPAEMIKSEVNYANSQTAYIKYIKEACLPVLDAFIDIINNKLIADLNETKFFHYDNPVNEDREILLKEATQLKTAGIVTTNEARSLMDYAPLEGGDVLAPSGIPQLTLNNVLDYRKNKELKKKARNVLKRRPIIMKKFKAVSALTTLMQQEKEVARFRNPVFNTLDAKIEYAKAYNKNVDNKAQTFKDTVDVYNQDFIKRIMDHIEKFGINPESIFDVTTEIVEAKKIFNPLMLNMFNKAGQDTLNHVASGFASHKASEQFYTPEEMKKQLENRAEFFITSMLDTDFTALQNIIVDQMSQGEGIDVIGRKIRQYFDDMSVSRAKTIARTETGRLMSQATNEAYRQSKFVTGKEWITAGDDRVRDEHVLNSGHIVDVNTNAAFPDGEHYPGETSINCRCVLGPAI